MSVLSCFDASVGGLPGAYWTGTSNDQALGLTSGGYLYDCRSAS